MFKNMRPMTIFASGVLFGTAGLKLLGCRDARKVYAHAVAAGLRAKDSLMNAVTVLREHTSDIVAEAREINEARAAQVDGVVEDKSHE